MVVWPNRRKDEPDDSGPRKSYKALQVQVTHALKRMRAYAGADDTPTAYTSHPAAARCLSEAQSAIADAVEADPRGPHA